MLYQVELQTVSPKLIAAVRAKTNREMLGATIRSSLDKVYAVLCATPIRDDGINIVVYLDGEMNLEVGVLVPEEFAAVGEVLCLITPSGLAAHATYFGDYAGMSVAHSAILEWFKTSGKTWAGPSWEVYGHWSDDPAKVRTDIYYLVAQ